MNIMNIPNYLSISRVLAVPVFIILMMDPTPVRAVIAGAVFAIASATDWLDGYLARKWGQITRIGKLLDPIADKILISSALILLVELDSSKVPDCAPWLRATESSSRRRRLENTK
jgi:CDP-diacylglycerol--glycerol-3-phosphate 3-phosphatidyltransferase